MCAAAVIVASGGYGLPIACCLRSKLSRCPCANRMRAIVGAAARVYFVAAMRTAARASLVLLALVLPFEPRQPIAHLGPLELTLVELALYAAIALGGAVIVADFARRGWRISWRDAARRHAVAIAWLLALALSAAAADFARADAVKFALRAAGGLALYVVAAAMVRRTAAVALVVAGGIVAGATIAALAMCAEIHVPGADGRAGPISLAHVPGPRVAARERAVSVPEHRSDVRRGGVAAGHRRRERGRRPPPRRRARARDRRPRRRRRGGRAAGVRPVADGVARGAGHGGGGAGGRRSVRAVAARAVALAGGGGAGGDGRDRRRRGDDRPAREPAAAVLEGRGLVSLADRAGHAVPSVGRRRRR